MSEKSNRTGATSLPNVPPPCNQDMAAAEAKSSPKRVFAKGWLEWLTASTRAPCDKGLVKVIQFVLNAGMLDHDPRARPQTVTVARVLLQEALRIYEVHEAAERSP